MPWTRLLRRAGIAAGLLLLSASPAEAQWYVGAQFGANRTQAAEVTVDAASQGIAQQFHDVQFDSRAFSSPPYYGWRVGRVLGQSRGLTFALEMEFMHSKVYADTGRTYVVTPIGTGTPSTTFAAMNDTVQRLNMSHGLNFVLANLVLQAPLSHSAGAPVRLDVRAGIGPTIPHVESTVLGESREQYEYGGMAFGAGVGVSIHLVGPISALTEYKVTFARPEVDRKSVV